MNNSSLNNLNFVWSYLTINELILNKITQFYIAPGMRNAPIISAVEFFSSQNKCSFEIGVDERALSYRALGYSKASGIASVIICTSGTALANFLPAIIEAKKSQIPLIILSADRPFELINSDDNQTIEQIHFFRPWINADLCLGTPSIEISPRALTTSINELVFKSIFPVSGPVHFNMMFREPLGSDSQEYSNDYKNLASNELIKTKPSTQYQIPHLTLNEEALQSLIIDINQAKTGLLVIGSLPNNIDKNLITELIERCQFNFFVEVGSSLKYQYNLNDFQIPTFDHPEVQEALKAHPPDLVIHLGGRLTSKFYYQYLTKNQDCNLYVLNQTSDKEDPTHLVKKRFVIDLNATLKQLNLNITKINRIQIPLNLKEFSHKKANFIESSPLSFPVISKKVIETIPDHSHLYLGNSTSIRTFDSYVTDRFRKHLNVFTNRGVSGIEGFIASSMGVIDALGKDVYLVLGDVSFIHDMNSLFFLTKKTKARLKIILINNHGGAIFTLLPIQKDKEILNIITSPHSFNFQGVEGLNPDIKYKNVKEKNELDHQLNWLYQINDHAILEIFIDDLVNIEVYNQLKTIR